MICYMNTSNVETRNLSSTFYKREFAPKERRCDILMDHSVEEPHKIEEIKGVYCLIVKYADNICRHQSRKIPLPVSDAGRKNHTISELMNEKFKLEGSENEFTVMEYACKVQAGEMIEEILNTEDVFKWHDDVCESVYLVTNLVPETFSKAETNPEKDSNKDSNEDDDIYDSDDDNCNVVKSEITEDLTPLSPLKISDGTSFLELLIQCSNSDESDSRIAKLLNREPFRSLTENYIMQYWRFHVFLLMVHFLYMSLFTSYLTPTNDLMQVNSSLYQNSCAASNLPDLHLHHTTTSMKIFCICVWLFWPIFIIRLGLIETAQHLFEYIKSESNIVSVWQRLDAKDLRLELKVRNHCRLNSD